MAHEERGLTNRLAGEIARTYAVHQKVLASVLRPFAELKANSSDVRLAKFKIREIVRRLDVYAVIWAKGSISVAYKAKRAEIEPLAKQAAVFATGERVDPSKTRIARRAETAARDFLKANRTIEKTAAAFLSAFEQAIGAVGTAEARTETQFMAADMGTEMARKSKYYLSRGYDAQSISRKLRQYLEKLVDGKDFIEVAGRFYNLRVYAEMVARAELHDAYVDATIDECAKWDCDLVQFSRHDSPCPICATLEGKVFSISGEDEEFPPLNEPWEVEVQTKTEIKTVKVDLKNPHPNCCLPGTTVEVVGDIVAGSRLIYEGWQVDLVLANGTRLSVTKNHLLLTPYGFAPAHSLYKGDYVFYSPGSKGMIATDPNDYREPTLIEQIITALAKAKGMDAGSVPVSAEDFHGDGRFINGNIDVIGPDSFLGTNGKSLLAQKSDAQNLYRTDIGMNQFPGSSDFATVLKSLALTADSLVGGLRAPTPVFLARPTGRDPVTLADRPEIAVDLREFDMNGLVGNSEPFRKIALQSTRPIEIQKIVAVDFFMYHGFVYDLQTESSLYIANGILSSNCEHNLNPVTRNILRASGELG